MIKDLYYDVVNKDTAYLQDVFSQAILHEALISSWCIGKTERHPVKLEETKWSYEESSSFDQGKTDKVVNWPTPTTLED
jgi:hypothetical protein